MSRLPTRLASSSEDASFPPCSRIMMFSSVGLRCLYHCRSCLSLRFFLFFPFLSFRYNTVVFTSWSGVSRRRRRRRRRLLTCMSSSNHHILVVLLFAIVIAVVVWWWWYRRRRRLLRRSSSSRDVIVLFFFPTRYYPVHNYRTCTNLHTYCTGHITRNPRIFD